MCVYANIFLYLSAFVNSVTCDILQYIFRNSADLILADTCKLAFSSFPCVRVQDNSRLCYSIYSSKHVSFNSALVYPHPSFASPLSCDPIQHGPNKLVPELRQPHAEYAITGVPLLSACRRYWIPHTLPRDTSPLHGCWFVAQF